MDSLTEFGLYKLSDAYFERFKNPYMIQNKSENRPFYYLFKDPDGVDWLIPLSSQVNNYQLKIQRIEKKRGIGNCVYYHIGAIAGQPRVFLIGDMLPVTIEYIKAPFFISSVPYIVRDAKLNSAVYSKAMRFYKLLSSGKIKPYVDVLSIKSALIKI